MADDRKARLQKLITLQRKLKAIHEIRQATHLVEAARQEEEARAIAARIDDPASMATLFPGVYQRGVTQAVEKSREAGAQARIEADKAAVATRRETMVEDAYHRVSREVDRQRMERDTLEHVERRIEPRRK